MQFLLWFVLAFISAFAGYSGYAGKYTLLVYIVALFCVAIGILRQLASVPLTSSSD